MKFMKNFYRILNGLLMIGLLMGSFPLSAYDKEYAVAMSNEALNAFDRIELEKKEEPIFEQGFIVNLKKLFQPYKLKFTPPSEGNMLESAFLEFPTKELAREEEVIDKHSVRQLEVIRGESRPEDNLMNRVTGFLEEQKSFLSTTAGRKSFVEMVTMPMTDIQIVEQRQEVIRELSEHPEALNKAYVLLQKMKANEPYFYELYQRDGLTDMEKTLYPGYLMQLLQLAEVPAAVSFTNRWITFSPAVIQAIITGTGYYLGRQLKKEFAKQEKDISSAPMAAAVGYSLLNLPAVLSHTGAIVGMVQALMSMQERLIHVATFIRSGQQLIQLMHKNPAIAASLPGLKEELARLVDGIGTSKKFYYLNQLLRKSTFDEGAPSVWSSPGNIMVAYKYITEKLTRQEYASTMNMLGDLDAYVALAKKMYEQKDEQATFCFAQFKPYAKQPMIEAVDFWNPFIPHTKVVPNTVSLNTGNERNMIITGPNTGGKSTIMKALMFSVLLAQTFGIAPAKKLIITPFTKLISYLNINDDTGAGISLFKAEVKRAAELMHTLRGLRGNEFAFVMIDEIFQGTTADKASELSYKFLKKLNDEFKNVIFINATHHAGVPEIEAESNGESKNYHPDVVMDENGRIIRYTYKLVPGRGTVSSAQQVAEEEGIEF